MPPKRARRAPAPKTTAGPVTRAASKVTKPTAERAAPSKAAPKKSPKKATKTAGSKKGKEPAGSRSLTPEDPMEVDSARNPRWPAGKKDYDKFVDYSVMAAYANGANIERPPRGKKNPRWRHEGNEPLTTPELLPEGWNPNELDLYEDEIEAQITRCEERISDNIFVEMFKRRLEIYLTKRQEREDMIASEPEGLDWETVQRLNSLRIIEEHLTEQRDGDGQLPNVKAIQKAYRNREMLFIHGMISYWRKGEQIGAPEPWDAKRDEAYMRQNGSHREFWVEGFFGAKPMPQMQYAIYGQSPFHPTHSMLTEMRTVGASATCMPYIRPVLYDTGATTMSINEEDVDWLAYLYGIVLPTRGILTIDTANGITSRRVVDIEVTIRDANGDVMCPYIKVPTIVQPDPNATRLTGPWMRFVLFTGTSPISDNLTLSDEKQELFQYLPDWRLAGTVP